MHVMIRPVAMGRPSFLGVPRCTTLELLDADVAILGIPFTTPDDLGQSRSPSSDAPDAVRGQSERLAGFLTHYDFDLGGSLFDGRKVSMVDCGDVWGEPGKFDDNNRLATVTVQAIRETGALPIVLGGDQAALPPALRAYTGHPSLCVVHIGAGLRWCDEVGGVHEGPRTAMRRASELPWVTSMIQVGLRGDGQARQQDRAEAYCISLDADGLDPAIAPGVALPAFGGLSYYEASNLLKAWLRVGPSSDWPCSGLCRLTT